MVKTCFFLPLAEKVSYFSRVLSSRFFDYREQSFLVLYLFICLVGVG